MDVAEDEGLAAVTTQLVAAKLDETQKAPVDDEADRWAALATKLTAAGIDKTQKARAWVKLVNMPLRTAERIFLAPDVDEALLQLGTGQEDIQAAVREVLAPFGAVVYSWAQMQLNSYRETSSTSKTARKEFRPQLIDFYQPGTGNKLMCMVTGLWLNADDITAAHIIPQKKSSEALALMQLSTMDVKNGVLWLSVLERAWSLHKIAFSFTEEGFQFRLLDRQLAGVRLVDYVNEKHADAKGITLTKCTKRVLRDKTFGQLHEGAKLTFLPNNPNRPFKRALCFMSHINTFLAESDGLQPVTEVDLAAPEYDYWTEAAYKQTVTSWLKGAQLAPMQ